MLLRRRLDVIEKDEKRKKKPLNTPKMVWKQNANSHTQAYYDEMACSQSISSALSRAATAAGSM